MTPFALCILVALVSGCGLTIRAPSTPAFDNLSGTYTYVGLGSFAPWQFPNPLIDFKHIDEPCDVEVRHEEGIIRTVYTNSLGSPVSRTVDLNKKGKGISWKTNELVTTQRVPIAGPIILPLPGRHYRGTRIFLDRDGNLVVVGFFKERGLFWTDYSEDEIILKRKKN